MAYNLHYANVLMNGGGSIYILSGGAGGTDGAEEPYYMTSETALTPGCSKNLMACSMQLSAM